MLYEINITRIERQLSYLQQCHEVIQQVSQGDLRDFFARSRAIHIAVECMIDIGNTIIDGFIMRDPGGYIDIVDIMSDEQVISKSTADELKQWVLFRDRLVRHYTDVQEEDLAPFISTHSLLSDFGAQVQSFLQREREKGNI